MKHRSQEDRLNLILLAFLLAFGLVCLNLVYWSVFRANAILSRDDNPRHVANELRIKRGTIYDINNIPLAESIGEDVQTRKYAESVETAVGFYSIEYETAGIEAGFDDFLAGKTESTIEQIGRETLNQPREGGDVRLTIHHEWQKSVADQLAQTADAGAVLLISLPDNNIRSMASVPTYDANNFEEQFDQLSDQPLSPLLNRVTNAQYQPGSVLFPFLATSAIDQSFEAILEKENELTRAFIIPPTKLDCISDFEIIDWKTALANGCPQPIQSLYWRWSLYDLQQVYFDWGWTQTPQLGRELTIPQSKEIALINNALAGQDTLLLTPLQMAQSWSNLLTNRTGTELQLVQATRKNDLQNWQVLYTDPIETIEQSKEKSTVLMKEILRKTSGQIEYIGRAVAGPDGEENLWYLGAYPANSPKYAVVIVIENGSVESIRELGRSSLRIPYE